MPKETKRSSVFIHLDGESNFVNAQINYETIFTDDTGEVILREPADSEQLANSDLTLDDLLPKILAPIGENAKLKAELTAAQARASELEAQNAELIAALEAL